MALTGTVVAHCFRRSAAASPPSRCRPVAGWPFGAGRGREPMKAAGVPGRVARWAGTGRRCTKNRPRTLCGGGTGPKAKGHQDRTGGNTVEKDILKQNKESWDAIADSFFGVTALPVYGCFIPTEDELGLFPALLHKNVLDVGCGSGHSLKWCGDKGAAELWGLDLSSKQIENATKFLAGNGYKANLFNAPMERDPGIPKNYFDVVYSIYAIGWTMDLQTTFHLISSYLKKDGIFIFSWDHPFMHCVEAADNTLIFSGSYYEEKPVTFKKDIKKSANRNNPDLEKESGYPLTLYNRRLCDYINALAQAGFSVERIVEETDKQTLDGDYECSARYYSACKAKHFPQSIVFKARKL